MVSYHSDVTMVMLNVGVILQEDLKLVDMTNPFFVASLKRGIQAFRCVCVCVCTVFRYCAAYDECFLLCIQTMWLQP